MFDNSYTLDINSSFCAVLQTSVILNQHFYNPSITDRLSVRDLSAFKQTAAAFFHSTCSQCLSTNLPLWACMARHHQTIFQLTELVHVLMCAHVFAYMDMCVSVRRRAKYFFFPLPSTLALWLTSRDLHDLFNTGKQSSKHITVFHQSQSYYPNLSF